MSTQLIIRCKILAQTLGVKSLLSIEQSTHRSLGIIQRDKLVKATLKLINVGTLKASTRS